MARFDGKTAFITGAARGQGRSHAVKLAEEGANILALDICEQMEDAAYEMSTPEDLEETARLVEKQGARIIARHGDVRDLGSLESVVEEGITEFGNIDIVCANAGMGPDFSLTWEFTERQWKDVIDVNLNGVWHTAKATVPRMIEAGKGGSIVITSSLFGIKGGPYFGPYVASKHGTLGIMKTLAAELAEHGIRVNAIVPTTVGTDMLLNDRTYGMMRPDLKTPTKDDIKEPFLADNALAVPWVESEDITAALLWLSSDEARYVTGITMPVDAGAAL